MIITLRINMKNVNKGIGGINTQLLYKFSEIINWMWKQVFSVLQLCLLITVKLYTFENICIKHIPWCSFLVQFGLD